MNPNFLLRFVSVLFVGWMGGVTALAAQLSYPLQLQTPKVESLSTSLSPTGGLVAVQVQVRYDAKGSVVCTGSVDNLPATCKGTLKTTAAGTTYKFSLRAAATPASVVAVSGLVGQPTALCTYSGPRGRFSNPSNLVNVTATQPVAATLRLSPVTSDKNLVAGSGEIAAGYTADLAKAGTVKGKVSSNSISLQIKQDKRMALYNGVRQGSTYVGPLRVTIPPAKETIANFAMPAMDLPLASGSAVFRGTLLTISNQVPVPAAGAVVTVRSDLNGDGKFLGREILRAVASAQGHYEIKGAVVRGRKVLLEIRSPGLADILVAYESLAPDAIVVKNATLQPLAVLSVEGGTAQADDGSILLDGLPSAVEAVQARTFNPRTETSQFPGRFADNGGNLLVSSVFASIEATDGAGRSVTNLGTNAILCMKVPADCWATMGDLTPGNERIDVPLYYYDEETGQWVRHSSDGWLEDVGRQVIPEEILPYIRNGTYAGDVFVAGQITHLSWWNLDWPVSTHSSIRGIIVDPIGDPVRGALFTAIGLSYNGTSGPELVADDGSFCIDIMRSEGPGEDLDRDGVEGETHKVQLKVQSGTNIYAFGPFSTTVAPGSCGAGGLDVGTLTLTPTNALVPDKCLVTGQVVYSGITSGASPGVAEGAGVRATVFAFDPDALEFAGGVCTNCTALTDSLGHFSLNVPIISGMTIAAYYNRGGSNGFGMFAGTMTVAGCPSGQVILPVDFYDLGALLLTFEDSHDDYIGSGVVMGEAIQATLYPDYPNLSKAYLGSQRNEGLPTQLGVWKAFALGDTSNNFSYVGLLTIEVTNLVPLRGTWKLERGPVRVLDGRWYSQFAGE